MLIVSVGLLAALLGWWSRLPVLVVYYGPEAKQAIDWDGFLAPLREAGIQRVQLVEGLPPEGTLGETPRRVSIAVALSNERNPALDEEMLARGLTGPGYTLERTCFVYKPDVALFLAKHKGSLKALGAKDWDQVKRRLITNTAVHEAWHAITQSTSHNPRDPESLMYMDPGRSPQTYCLERPHFTLGHRERLRERFRFSVE